MPHFKSFTLKITLVVFIGLYFNRYLFNNTQAIERAGMKSGNKGWSAALSAIEMANLIEAIDKT